VSTLDVIVEMLDCSRVVTSCSAASSWVCWRLSGGPASQSWMAWIPCDALVAILGMLPATELTIRAIIPASTTIPPSSTAEAAIAGGRSRRRNHAVGGHSIVARISASITGSTIDQR
jgi:hypothetical protein